MHTFHEPGEKHGKRPRVLFAITLKILSSAIWTVEPNGRGAVEQTRLQVSTVNTRKALCRCQRFSLTLYHMGTRRATNFMAPLEAELIFRADESYKATHKLGNLRPLRFSYGMVWYRRRLPVMYAW